MRWRVYYDDRPPFSDVDGSPDLAPVWGVQAIVQTHPEVGREIEHRKDCYVWTVDGWWGVDERGFYDYLTRPGWKRVLFGRTVPNQVYERCFRQAIDDPDFPRKSAFTPREAS